MVVTVLVGYGLLMALAWQELSAIDGLLLAMSAFGNAGLTPIDLSRLSAPAVLVLAALNFAGGMIIGSIAPVALRRHYIRRTLPPAARAHFTEYCALGKVQALVLTFVATLHFAVFVMLAVWFVATPSAAMLLRPSGPSALGFSAYLAVSAVQNTGMALAPDNLTAFFAEWFPLMVVAFGVLAGATLYPVVLRAIVVVLARCTRGHDRTVYRFLLRFPRRCYTHLFPAAETYWLLLVGIALPVLQFALFAALNWNGQAAFSFMSGGQKFWNTVFMSTTTRTGGFNTINIAQLNPGMQTLLLGFMYLAVLPVVVAVRYSDRSLQPLRRTSMAHLLPDVEGRVLVDEVRGGNTVRAHAKGVLTQHVLWLFIAWTAVCIVEAGRIQSDPNFSAFSILFEIVSGFGLVGLSLGYPNVPASFCTVWAPLSKLFLITVIFLGRLRGLPLSIDRAVRIVPASAPAVESARMVLRVPGASQVDHHGGGPDGRDDRERGGGERGNGDRGGDERDGDRGGDRRDGERGGGGPGGDMLHTYVVRLHQPDTLSGADHVVLEVTHLRSPPHLYR